MFELIELNTAKVGHSKERVSIFKMEEGNDSVADNWEQEFQSTEIMNER